MALTSHIIAKALKDTGIYVSEGNSIPGDYYFPCFELLKDLVAELNSQTAIQFEQQVDNYDMSGSKLTFKKYTDEELEIITSGGSIDITDRFIDFVPLTTPKVYIDGYHLEYISYRDLLDRMFDDMPEFYTFNVGNDYSELVFNAPVSSTITLLRTVPIRIDDEPYGNLYVPDAYVHYIVIRLSEMVATRYQFTETALIFAQKSEKTGNILTNNNTSRKPVKRNLAAGLNKFRKYY